MRVFATYSIKGGVGKTSSAVSLAALAAAAGERTLVWDLDPQGAASYCFRIEAKVKGGGRRLVRGRSDVARLIRATDVDNLDLLPADFSYRHLDLDLDDSKKPTRRLRKVLKTVADDYDVAFLDCAPSISLASEAVFEAADALLVPALPSPLSLRTVAQLTRHLDSLDGRRPRVLVFFCMVDRRKALHRRTLSWTSARSLGFLRTVIPSSSLVEQMAVRRAPLTEIAPRSSAAVAYAALWDEVRERLAEAPPEPPGKRELKELLRGERG